MYRLGHGVLRTFATLWYLPRYVLAGIFNVARLAMYTAAIASVPASVQGRGVLLLTIDLKPHT